MIPTTRLLAASALAAMMATATTPSQAALTLTAAGIAQGLSLSTFVDGLPNASTIGPIAVGFPTGGNVLVSDWANGKIIAFSSDADGQHYADGTPSTSDYNRPTGMASSGGTVYMAAQGSGSVVTLDANGNYTGTFASGLGSATGLAIGGGYAYISNVSNEIFKFDLATQIGTVLVSGQAVDGITLSPDGTVLYGRAGDFHIYGWDTTTGAFTGYDSGAISGADGAAAAVGSLAGNIFVNTNNGELWEVDALGNQTLIANGGSRGDLVTIDPTNGSLLISQTDSIVRLTLPSGSSFSSDVPEPASLALLGAGLLGLAGLRRKGRQTQG